MRKSFVGRSTRGVVVLGIVAVVAAGLLAGPVTAAGPVTKKQVKRIAKRVATKVVNDLTYTKPQADERFAPRLFAIVAQNGSLVRGSGVLRTQRNGSGDYSVVFSRNLTGCAGVASLGGHAIGPDSNTGSSFGQAHVIVPADTGSGANAVVVRTTNSAGTPQDSEFHLIVVC